jgi:hypothetical protein
VKVNFKEIYDLWKQRVNKEKGILYLILDSSYSEKWIL